eukprot:1641744-Pleurochrysis_carterae.AAC.1
MLTSLRASTSLDSLPSTTLFRETSRLIIHLRHTPHSPVNAVLQVNDGRKAWRADGGGFKPRAYKRIGNDPSLDEPRVLQLLSERADARKARCECGEREREMDAQAGKQIDRQTLTDEQAGRRADRERGKQATG